MTTETRSDLLTALLNRIPKSGSYWSRPDRDRWVGLATTIFEVEFTDQPRKRRKTAGEAGGGTGPEQIGAMAVTGSGANAEVGENPDEANEPDPGAASYDPVTGELREYEEPEADEADPDAG